MDFSNKKQKILNFVKMQVVRHAKAEPIKYNLIRSMIALAKK